jgi:hypothetical protein
MTRVLDTDDAAPVTADAGPVVAGSSEGGGFRLEVSDVHASPPAHSYGHSTVWTGTELIVWGGYSSDNGVETPVNSGAAYDPTTSTWRTIPDAPISGRAMHAAHWTGSEMIVWGGLSSDGSTVGAAYSPSEDTWRLLTDAPISNRFDAISAWTGDDLIVWGGSSTADGADTVPFNDGAIYDVAADRWRMMPSAPVGRRTGSDAGVWLRGRLVIGCDDAGTDGDGYVFAAYDPAVGEWTSLPAPPDNPDGEPVGYLAVLATDGDVLYVLDRIHGAFAELDIDTASWRSLAPTSDPSPNVVAFMIGSTPAVLADAASAGEMIEFYDRSHNVWVPVDAGLVHAGNTAPVAVSMNVDGYDALERAVVWGVTHGPADAVQLDGVLLDLVQRPTPTSELREDERRRFEDEQRRRAEQAALARRARTLSSMIADEQADE